MTKEIKQQAVADELQLADNKTLEEKAQFAKAGKRSKKTLEEKAEIIAKKDKLAAKLNEPKTNHKPITRSKLERRSKNYKKVQALIDPQQEYELTEATKLVNKLSTTKFNSSVELHLQLNVDPRQADQNIRDNVVLPAGSGKIVRVALFVPEEEKHNYSASGADIIGDQTIIKAIESAKIDFDILITSPDQMPKLSKYARVLGPKGLMPNPKSGTVTTNLDQAVSQAKAGKIEYRVDAQGNIHVNVGKVSFKSQELASNIQAVLESISQNKPASVKGLYIKSKYLATTMSPALKLK